ncbi:hypothetical protein V6N11_010598 [Hibiscus sabdariffa]|uniref:Uncharacterized protein n=1 Tax=Hibiscus sabdariffa TaxID=183260 RepID=A0ABR2S5Y9_9ROSI
MRHGNTTEWQIKLIGFQTQNRIEQHETFNPFNSVKIFGLVITQIHIRDPEETSERLNAREGSKGKREIGREAYREYASVSERKRIERRKDLRALKERKFSNEQLERWREMR